MFVPSIQLLRQLFISVTLLMILFVLLYLTGTTTYSFSSVISLTVQRSARQVKWRSPNKTTYRESSNSRHTAYVADTKNASSSLAVVFSPMATPAAVSVTAAQLETTTTTTTTTAISVTELSVAETSQSTQPACVVGVMTLVSGYLNIGSFQKGQALKFSTRDYESWSTPFAFIENPVVFYTDDEEMASLIRKARSSPELASCTRIHLVNRTAFWGFQLLGNISDVINQPGYPKLHPNTVVPEYAAVMHAKFSMLELAISEAPFATEFYAWMDSGLFRQEVSQKSPIRLLPPIGFDKQRVAINQVLQKFSFTRSLVEVFHSEWPVFVGGGFLIATKSVMRAWCEQYRRFTEYFLSIGLSNSDQQVIYGMIHPHNDSISTNYSSIPAVRPNATVKLQRFTAESPTDMASWYHLRWLSQDEGLRQRRRAAVSANTAEGHLQSYLKLEGSASSMKDVETIFQPNADLARCVSNVTVVVAFFSFGSFAVPADKEDFWIVRDSIWYSRNLAALAKTRNPLVAYFDCPTLLGRFQQERTAAGLAGCSHYTLVNRETFWPWRMLPWLDFTMRNHEKKNRGVGVSENLRFPEYVAARHSKYAVLQRATENNPFNTTHFAWLDVSLGRNLTDAPPFVVVRGSGNENFEFPIGFNYSSEENGEKYEEKGRRCRFRLSNQLMIGERFMLRNLSKAYRSAAEVTMLEGRLLIDEALLDAMYCMRKLSEKVVKKTGYDLPPIAPRKIPAARNKGRD